MTQVNKMQLEKFPDSMTVKELRSFLRENWEKGCTCVCTNHVQLYRRPITSAMAYGLILFYRHDTTREFIHAEDFFKGVANLPSSIRGDFSKLRFWGLIQANSENEGWYKVTFSGMAFVLGRIKVQSHVKLFNNKKYGMDGEEIDIHGCLKNKFDYNLLMQGLL